MAVLQIIKGGQEGKVFPLPGERVVIGRHPNCHVVLENGAVSRHHAQVLESHGHYYIEDLRSRNGTYLNGELIEGRSELGEGDNVKLCDVLLSFHLKPPGGEVSDPTMVSSSPRSHAKGMRTTKQVAIEGDDGSQYFMMPQSDGDIDIESSSIITRLGAQSPSDERATVSAELKLKVIRRISEALAGELELDIVLPKILASLFDIFPQAEQGFVLLKDPDSEKLLVKATRSRMPIREDSVAVSLTVVKQTMNTGEAILSENVMDDSRFNKSTSLSKLQIRSMMCAPLQDQKNNTLGVIQLDTRSSAHNFDSEDLDLLLSVAAQASLGLANAQLHTEVLKQRDMERDLEFAMQVQLGFLPKSRPKLKGYAFADYYEAALRVGGDYFDYVALPDGRIAVTLGDVAGKGVPAALLMARLYSSARYHLLTASSLAEAVTGLNQDIASSGLGHRFITFFVMIIDAMTGHLLLVNAGHLSPVIRRADGSVESVTREESGLPLGIVPEQEYYEATAQLDHGDAIIGFTDGVTEAMDSNRDIFGRDRLVDCLKQTSGPVESLVQSIIGCVEQFSSDNVARDDTCVVAVHRLPKEGELDSDLTVAVDKQTA